MPKVINICDQLYFVIHLLKVIHESIKLIQFQFNVANYFNFFEYIYSQFMQLSISIIIENVSKNISFNNNNHYKNSKILKIFIYF